MTYVFATKEVQITIQATDRDAAEQELRLRISLLENMSVEVPPYQEYELQYAF